MKKYAASLTARTGDSRTWRRTGLSYMGPAFGHSSGVGKIFLLRVSR